MSGAELACSIGLSLFLTVALELTAALAAGFRSGRDLLLIVMVNVVTNPVVVLSYHTVSMHTCFNISATIICLEAWAILTEAWYYSKYGGFAQPLLFSVFVNLFSYGMGTVLNSVV